jgi:hypothetical protein
MLIYPSAAIFLELTRLGHDLFYNLLDGRSWRLRGSINCRVFSSRVFTGNLLGLCALL